MLIENYMRKQLVRITYKFNLKGTELFREAADKFANEQYAIFDHNRHCLESEDSMELDALPILPKK